MQLYLPNDNPVSELTGAAPGHSEDECQAQNNIMVQPIFPPKKLVVAFAMSKILEVVGA